MNTTIMIVEDSKAIAKQIRDWIKELDYDVFSIVNTGAMAINKVAKDHHPDIILMDITLEDRTSGIDVAKRIHEKSIDVPIIYMSSGYTENLLKEIKETEPYNYLLKPFTKRDLHVAIEVALRLHAKEKELEQYKNHLEFCVEERTLELKQEIETRKMVEDSLDELYKELAQEVIKVHNSEKNFRALMEAIPDVVYKVDEKGCFTYINGAIKNYGYDPEILIGKHFSKLIPTEDVDKISRDKVLTKYEGVETGYEEQPKLFDERRTGQRTTKGLEVRINVKDDNKKDKDSLVAEINSSGIYEAGSSLNDVQFKGSFGVIKMREKDFSGSVGVVRDITERKELEDKLKKQEEELRELNRNLEMRVNSEIKKRRRQEEILVQQSKLAAMGEMIGAIAHQWRQPLTALGLAVQDFQDAYHYGELDEDYLDKMVKSSMSQIQYMSKTIDDFRNFFKPEKDKSSFNIAKTIKEVISLISAQLDNANIRVELRTESVESLTIKSYLNEFMQVVINILHNARDAVLQRVRQGRISSENRVVSIKINSVNEKILIKISDRAGGIPENIIDKIFEPYFTTKEEGKGTGVGLYMSKVIIEKNMNGKLYAENSGDGAVFTIELPRISEL